MTDLNLMRNDELAITSASLKSDSEIQRISLFLKYHNSPRFPETLLETPFLERLSAKPQTATFSVAAVKHGTT